MTTANIISIAKICVSLTLKAVVQGVEDDYLLPRKIYCTYQSVSDLYNDSPSDASMTKIANYLYAICGGYGFAAQAILGTGGGGIIVNPSTSSSYTPVPISVTISAGQSGVKTIQSNSWIGLQYVNYVVINQNYFQIGSQFTFNSVTGTFDFSLYNYTLQTNDVMTSFGYLVA
jgi:hypothetical protein